MINLTTQLASISVCHAIALLQEHEEGLAIKQIKSEVEAYLRKRGDISPHLFESSSSGSPRWRHNFLWHTVGITKMGYLVKNKGFWQLSGKAFAELETKSPDETSS